MLHRKIRGLRHCCNLYWLEREWGRHCAVTRADPEWGTGGPDPPWNFGKKVAIIFVIGTGLILHSIYINYSHKSKKGSKCADLMVRTWNVDFSCIRLTPTEIRKSKVSYNKTSGFLVGPPLPPEKDIWIRACCNLYWLEMEWGRHCHVETCGIVVRTTSVCMLLYYYVLLQFVFQFVIKPSFTIIQLSINRKEWNYGLGLSISKIYLELS